MVAAKKLHSQWGLAAKNASVPLQTKAADLLPSRRGLSPIVHSGWHPETGGFCSLLQTGGLTFFFLLPSFGTVSFVSRVSRRGYLLLRKTFSVDFLRVRRRIDGGE